MFFIHPRYTYSERQEQLRREARNLQDVINEDFEETNKRLTNRSKSMGLKRKKGRR